MANQNAQPATPANQPAVVSGPEAEAPEAKNILEDVCEIESAKAENTHMIERPPLGETREVDLQDGQNYIFGFAKDDAASFIEENGTLTVTFDCGGKLVLNNYSSVITGDDASTFAFSDVMPQGELSSLIKVVDTTKEDAVDPENTAKNVKTAKSVSAADVANIEPAAGDEAPNARDLAQIEPAAGEAAGGASGGGYGFNSSYATTPVGPLNAVGPLGATQLAYGANFREPNPLLGEDEERDPMNIGPGNEFIDETNLAGGPVVETGTINIDYGADGPGAIGPNGDFFSSGSMTGGNLTSNGDAVVVTQTATGYVGIANGVTVFTLDIQSPSGDYTFTLFQPLDHADGTDPNDTIGLTFGVIATDGDGDPVQTSLTVVVADDAPILDGDGVKSIDEDDLPGASVSGNLVEQFGSDGAGDIHTTGVSNASGDLAGGVLSSGGHPVVITFNGTSYTGTANGVEVFKLTITDQQTGAYTFNLLQPLDHSVGGDTITLTFGAEIVDFDGDKDPANIVIAITDDVPEIKDGNPTIGNGLEVVDETNLNGASITVNGNLPFDAGSDTPATIQPNGNVVEGGSMTAGNLTSHGVEVVITQTANGYVGTANGNPVFTFTIGNNGAYSFTLQDQLDHADGTDANDVINLRFGVKITDNDGDTDDGFVNINIVDDAPVLADDGLKIVFEKDLTPTSVNGNLVEDFGEDGPGNIHTTGTHSVSGDLKNGALTSDGHPVVITSTPTGYVGTANGVEVFNLVITNQQTGAYTFTLLQPLDHGNGDGRLFIDFGVEIVDFDGDTDPATIHIKIFDDKPEIDDGKPEIGKGLEVVDETNLGPIVREGKVTFDFGGDGAGEFGPNSTSSSSVPLFSNGSAVTITGNANGYVGKTAGGDTIFTIAINADGTYKFTLIGVLDHPNGANPDDIITLNFGVKVTDADGDTDTGNITVRVHDDGPVAVDDGAFTDGNTLNGNVLTNDDAGADGLGAVTAVTFNGSTTTIAPGATVVVNGNHGVLTISSNGTYQYVPNGGTDGTDEFKYTMDDYDNDTDTAKLTIRVDNDDCPIIVKPAAEVVDETNLGPIVETGHVDANYFGDGPGAITANGDFTSGGSKLGGNLTSNGVAVNVTSTATGYVGTANGVEVFRLTVQPNGDYSFTLSDTLDHADGANPNDVINLRFGVTATDADGDTASTVITVNVLDDAPTLADDGLKIVFEKNLGPTSVSGDLVEDFGSDGAGEIQTTGTHTVSGDAKNGALSAGGVPVVVTSTDTGYVGKANGADVFKLVIDPLTGAYTFTLFKALDHGNGDGRLFIDFGVEIVDFDGDKDPATIHIKVFDGKPEIHDDNPTIGHGLEVVDETDLGPIVRNGAVDVDFGDDVPGTLGTNGVVTSTYPLTSHGTAIAIATTANGYTGTANGNTIFTLTINQDGTYTYTQIGVVDHANAADPNDSVTVNFGIKVTDADGDTDTGNITVRIHDDGPVAVDDIGSTDGNTLNGNVLTNDDAGADGLGAVTAVTFNGSTTNIANGATVVINGNHGVLTISSNGVYKYVPNGGTAGTDQFTYTMDDYDNDTDTAKLTIKVDNDDCPVIVKPATEVVDETNLGPIVETGHVDANYFGDGPGAITANGVFTSGGSKLGGNLTSNGFAVNVTSTATGYVGKANGVDVFKIVIQPNGDYTFTLLGVLDHADGTNPNDVINLRFGVKATDADGDTAETVITVNVLDDAPVAVDDGAFTDGNTLNGNVLTNDDAGSDGLGAVTKITFNGVTTNIANGATVVINGDHGVLTISSNGVYKYVPNGGTSGIDLFTYTMDDYDNDTDTAKLEICVDNDDCPVLVKPAVEVVDETNLGPIVENGIVQGNFFGDGPGTFKMDGNFSSTGSKLGGNLTSHGQPVIVTSTDTGYVGTANGAEIFKITINPATGAYQFTLLGVLDHADATNPNDVITLNFGVRGTDTDGDFDSTVIRVNVLDDAPIAHDDHNTQIGIATGNVVTGLNGGAGAADDLSNDRNDNNSNTVTKISFGGTTVNVPATGVATIDGAHGQLKISANGTYTYTPNPGVTSVGSTSETLVLKDAASGVEIEVNAVQTASGVQFTVELVNGTADLNGFFLDLQGNGGPLLYIGNTANNMNGTAGFDYGVVLGTVGGSDTDVTQATFTVNGLTIGDLESAKIGIRASSVGDYRADSLKLVGDIVVDTHECECGEDQFVYTLRDRDGDTSTAKLILECAPDTNVNIVVNNGGDKICIKEDGQGAVPVVANYTGGDGDEILTLKVTGIDTTWTVTAPGWTNNGSGVYTLTLPAGQHNYAGSFTFKPPHNSDVDMGNITFTASIHDPDTNGTKVATDSVRVQVDAVVDTPVLTVQDVAAKQFWYYKNQGYQVPLKITSNVTDTDGSEVVAKIVIKLNQPFTNPVPPYNTLDDMGIGLNKGTEVSPGVWEITVNAGDTTAALTGLKLVVPDNMNYGVIHQNKIGEHKVNIVVESHVKEKVVAGDGNGECDFSDNKTTVIKAICLTFAITPLVLDLNGNGIELVAAGEHVLFDMNNNGTHDQTTWVKGNDGMLAIDANHDGVINNQSELFGNTDTVDNGFANLAQYDSNHDGKIDISDAVYADLLVWQDTNQDGISQSGEMKSLADLGIASINLNATETNKPLADGFISHESTFTYTNGTIGAIVDANFNVIDGNDVDLGATLNGTEGKDAIYGTANNDVIIGHAGNDILYGSGGDDVFKFDAIDGSVDTIKDFNTGDVLDLSGIVHVADAVQDSINDFVFRTEVNGSTVISVDATGTGDTAHATVIAVLEGATGLDLNQIIQIQQAAA